jgi:hypothetical protein
VELAQISATVYNTHVLAIVKAVEHTSYVTQYKQAFLIFFWELGVFGTYKCGSAWPVPEHALVEDRNLNDLLLTALCHSYLAINISMKLSE